MGQVCGCCIGARQKSDKPEYSEEECKFVMSPPDGGLPAVQPLPKREKGLWANKVERRYLRQVMCDTWARCYCCNCCCGPRGEEVSDAEMGRMFDKTVFSCFLNKDLDEADRNAFHAFLGDDHDDAAAKEADPNDGRHFFKVDYSLQAKINPIPGTYTAAAVGLMSRTKFDEPIEPVAIKINDVVLDPKDGNAWELAKLYLMQGAAYDTLFVDHPQNAHFPVAVVTGHVKSMIPQDHVLFQLLDPHLYVSLGVNDSARFSANSIAISQKLKMPFMCLTYQGQKEVFKYFNAGVHGIEGNSSYEPYRFTLKPRANYTNYGKFLHAMWPPFKDLAQKVVAEIKKGDQVVTDWAEATSKALPGFPDGTQIWEEDQDEGMLVLALALAKVMWLESVEHSTSHHSFGKMNIPSQVPMRIRIEPPKSKDVQELNLNKMCTGWDRFQARLATLMFFQDIPVTRLKRVKYAWEGKNDELTAAAREFQERLTQTYNELPDCQKVIPLDRIAASLQY